MQEETVTVILPLPPAAINNNGQHGHWAKRATALKECRQLAKKAVDIQQIDGGWEKVEVKCIFFHKQKRRRDDINSLSRLKGYFDGIVDSGLVVDDDYEHWKTLTPNFKIDKEQGRVEIEIRRLL